MFVGFLIELSSVR